MSGMPTRSVTRSAIRSGTRSGDTDRKGYSVAGVARNRRDVIGCGDKIVGDCTSSITVLGITE